MRTPQPSRILPLRRSDARQTSNTPMHERRPHAACCALRRVGIDGDANIDEQGETDGVRVDTLRRYDRPIALAHMALGLRIELKLKLELKRNEMKYELPGPPSFCLRLGAASQDRDSIVHNALL
ncbi:hypothetical protein EYR40_002162 [Pleurotus pulmonarius]|nr:hypothetical protein EYR40_002162 [Pleurotus pulmonarius]